MDNVFFHPGACGRLCTDTIVEYCVDQRRYYEIMNVVWAILMIMTVV